MARLFNASAVIMSSGDENCDGSDEESDIDDVLTGQGEYSGLGTFLRVWPRNKIVHHELIHSFYVIVGLIVLLVMRDMSCQLPYLI